MSKDQLLGTTDASIRLGVSTPTVHAMHKRGELPAERTAGGQLIFKAGDVDRIVARKAKAKAAATG